MSRYRLSREPRLAYLQRMIDRSKPGARSMSEKNGSNGVPRGTYAHIKCEVCGHPLNLHPDTCVRHAFRPPWVFWLERNPDPRPLIAERIGNGSLRPDASAFTEAIEWAKAAQEAGVPDCVISEEPKAKAVPRTER